MKMALMSASAVFLRYVQVSERIMKMLYFNLSWNALLLSMQRDILLLSTLYMWLT